MSQRENSIEIVTADFDAGDDRLWHLSGSYFELIEATGPVDVILTDRNGAQRGRMLDAEASFHLKNTEFETIQLRSASAQQVRFAYGSGEAGTRRTAGSVNIANKRGGFTQAAANVTNASAQLLAANASRSYLLIQNNDASGDIYVTLDGGAATLAKGIKIAAGGSLELADFLPTDAVFAIGSIAANGNVVVVEG
jgi:hypothetical protein